MTEHERPSDELEQLLRDERALRIRAEARAVDQAEKTQIWRTRAEERADRIERLTAQPKRAKRRRKPAVDTQPTVPASSPTQTTSSTPPPPARLAAVRVATALLPEHAAFVSAFAAEDLRNTRAALAEADLVVVDTESLGQLSDKATDHFAQWLDSPARQPLVVMAGTPTQIEEQTIAAADAVFAADADSMAAWKHRGIDTMALDPVFDPVAANPIGRTWSVPDELVRDQRDGIPVVFAEDQLIGIETFPESHPPTWLIEAAASGIPVTAQGMNFDIPTELGRAGNAARRWAYRNHTPTARGAQIALAAGFSVPDPRPSAAAILVSMRPDQAIGALEMIRDQTYRPLSVVVGLHGSEPTREMIELIEQMAPTVTVTLLRFDADLTLGECLNRAIATTGAEVLVKIDDDDFYGPSHVEDGIHALEYSQAAIVGKGAQFTYLENEDTTVLRRQREEETFIGGSPTGATMLIRRSTWAPIGFPHRPRQVDVLFTRAARHNGATVYANSRWEFCYIRQASGHTWTTPSSTFLAGSQQLWTGLVPDKMVAPSLVQPTSP